MINLGKDNTVLVKCKTTNNVELCRGDDILTFAMKLYDKQPSAVMTLAYKVVGTPNWSEVLFGGLTVMFADRDGTVYDCGHEDMEWVIRVKDEWLEITRYNINELHDLF